MKTRQPGKIQPQPTEQQHGAREGSDIFIPGLVAFLIFMAFSAFVMHAGLFGWLKQLRGKVGIDLAQRFEYRASSRMAGAFPTLQIKPGTDWQSYSKLEGELLHSYAWVNKTAGIVRVPISVAVDRMLSEGVPHWGPTNRAISPLELQRARAKGGSK